MYTFEFSSENRANSSVYSYEPNETKKVKLLSTYKVQRRQNDRTHRTAERLKIEEEHIMENSFLDAVIGNIDPSIATADTAHAGSHTSTIYKPSEAEIAAEMNAFDKAAMNKRLDFMKSFGVTGLREKAPSAAAYARQNGMVLEINGQTYQHKAGKKLTDKQASDPIAKSNGIIALDVRVGNSASSHSKASLVNLLHASGLPLWADENLMIEAKIRQQEAGEKVVDGEIKKIKAMTKKTLTIKAKSSNVTILPGYVEYKENGEIVTKTVKVPTDQTETFMDGTETKTRDIKAPVTVPVFVVDPSIQGEDLANKKFYNKKAEDIDYLNNANDLRAVQQMLVRNKIATDRAGKA